MQLLIFVLTQTNYAKTQVLFIFHRIFLRRKGLPIIALELGGNCYMMWKSELITMEMYILKELAFSLYTITDHPHTYLLYFIKMLNGDNALAQMAWSYLNDSMRLSLCVQFPTQIIACAAIYLAARCLQFALPEDPEPWWKIMDTDVCTLHLAADKILRLYSLPRVSSIPPLYVSFSQYSIALVGGASGCRWLSCQVC